MTEPEKQTPIRGQVNYNNELRCGHIDESGRLCKRMIAKGDFPGKPIEAKCPRCGTLNIFWDPENTPV